MYRVLLLLGLLLPFAGHSQKPDTLIRKLDSLNKKEDSAGGQINNIHPGAYNESTQITFPGYFILLGSDLKQAFTKPFHMTGGDWKKTGEFALALGALSFADRPVQRAAVKARKNSEPLQKISRYITNAGGTYEAYGLGALTVWGFLFKKEKLKTTTLLASQAYLTGAAVETVAKFIAGRQRPYSANPDSVQMTPKFGGPLYKSPRDANGKKLYSSFPSGHTTVAFAAATVFAMEYKDKPWVPVLSYSAATLIGLSRITENKHWATDVLAGAALGYLSGRQVVNNYHRYAKLKAPRQPKNTVSFTLSADDFGKLMPTLVYKF